MTNAAKRWIECYNRARECAAGGGCPTEEMTELDAIEKSLTEEEKKQIDSYKKGG